jgi:formylglycine-generating enzyme required for sulfatase activity
MDYALAIAAKAVTVEQFQRFCKEKHQPLVQAAPRYQPDPNCPMHYVSWHRAAEYCNWLSQKEGISQDQWCYLPVTEGEHPRMKTASNYRTRTGYRLPSEAEWELACRAGVKTSRCYGEAEELLEKYAWYQKNSGSKLLIDDPARKILGVDDTGDQSWPVGHLMPNALGLFDVHGNVWNWCQDQQRIEGQEWHVARGGSFRSPAGLIRCHRYLWQLGTLEAVNVGFRVARTFPAK